MLIVQGLVFAVIYYLLFRFVIKAFNLKTPGREEDSADSAGVTTKSAASQDNEQAKVERAQAFITALGGKGNIKEIDACITRLRLILVDRNKINEAQLKALGSKGNIKLGDNALQVILGPEAELVADQMKKL